MKVKLLFTLIFISLLIISSCKEPKKTDSGQTSTPNDTTTLTSLTNKWNESIVKQDYQTLSNLYAEQVSTYGISISKEQAVTNKKDFFKAHPDFNQSITGEILISRIKDNSYKLSFPKRTNFDGTTSDINSYLIFEKIADTYKIVNESDETTDKNISKRIIQKNENEKVKCSDIVLQILESSQSFKTLTKGLTQRIKANGGQGFRVYLWASPNPKIDGSDSYSEDYEFSIHENYPDREPRIAEYKFSPKKQQLYKEDIAEMKYNSIQFDRQLLNTFLKSCN